MTTKTEQLDEKILANLKNYQSKLNDFTFELGQIEVNFIQLKNYKNSIENEYKTTKISFDEIIAELDKRYPNGVIDLGTGTIKYEE